MASHFSETVYGNKSELKPNCSQCWDNDCVEMVDSMLDNNNEQWSTLPIWYCSRCKKVFGDRSNKMTNIMDGHYYDRLTTTARFEILEKDNIENRVNNIETKIDNLNNEFQKQKEDVLHALKDRINSFKLS